MPNHFRLTVVGVNGRAETVLGAVHQTGSTSPQGLGDLEWVADSNYWARFEVTDACARSEPEAEAEAVTDR
jgi:hypothetical protein